jgi:hypothetical protein
MATKKRVKRFAEAGFVDQDAADQEATSMMKRGIVDQTEEEAANEAEMMSSMMRKRAMEEGDRDEKAMPKQDFMSSKEPEAPAKSAPVMRKPKPTNYGNEGRSSKAPVYSNEGRGSIPKKSAEEMRDEKVRNAYRVASDEPKAMFSKMAPTAAEYNAARIAMKPKFRASQGYASGGSVSASSRADGIATKGKTRGKIC